MSSKAGDYQFINKNIKADNNSDRDIAKVYKDESFDDLCRTILLILNATEGRLKLELGTGEIVDDWARSKKRSVIVPKAMAKHYVNWLNSFPDFIIK